MLVNLRGKVSHAVSFQLNIYMFWTNFILPFDNVSVGAHFKITRVVYNHNTLLSLFHNLQLQSGNKNA